jgi:NADH-quinone oxidoreductase subunit M
MILPEVTAAEQVGFPILSVLLILPIVVLVALQFVRNDGHAYRVALAGSVLELILAVWIALLFVRDVADMQFIEHVGPIPFLGFSYQLGVDGISVLFLPLTALMTVLVILYAEYAAKADTRHYMMATLGLEATLIGAFVSLDLILFWIFFVLELIPSYFLITRWGTGPGRVRAAREYLGFMLPGSVLMLIGIVLLGVNAGRETGSATFDFLELLTVPVPNGWQTVIFFLLFFGFAVKAPIFPFHTWMPKVLEEGPIVGMSVFLVGIKLGTYGLIRFVIPLTPDAAKEWFWVAATLGVAGMVYGALIALIQTNLRRLLAFSSLSHMGVVMLGLFSLNFAGFQGGLLQMINLGIVGAGLFFIAGFLHNRTGPPDLSVLGGLIHYVPTLTATFLVIAIAGVGLPGTNGFNGEHLVMIGAFQVHWVMAAASGLGVFLTGAYVLYYFLRGFLGEPATDQVKRTLETMPDLRRRELVIAITLGALVFWIGLDTGPILNTMNGSLRALETRIDQGSAATASYFTEMIWQLRGAPH